MHPGLLPGPERGEGATIKITVLTSDHCPPCRRLKQVLQSQPIEGAELEILTLEKEEDSDRFMELFNQHQVEFFPTAIMDGQKCEIGVQKGGDIFINCEEEAAELQEPQAETPPE